MRRRSLRIALVAALAVAGCSKGADTSTEEQDWQRCERQAQIDATLASDEARTTDFVACMEAEDWTCDDAEQPGSCTRLVDEDENDPSNNEYEFVENPFAP